MKRRQNIIEEDHWGRFFLVPFWQHYFRIKKWDQKEPTPMVPIRKKEKNYANNKSQKQKENEKHTFHNIFNFIITAI